MSTRPSTGRRPRHNGEEVDTFDHRHDYRHRAGRAKRVKQQANRRARRARRAAKRHHWTE